MPTGTVIVTAALNELGVYAPSDTIVTADSDYALLVLNRMISLWNAKKRFVYVSDISSYTITTSAASYTIGPSGASFTAARPVKIESINLIRVADTPDTRTPLTELTDKEYLSIQNYLDTADEPSYWFYRPTHPSGTLYLWPYPTNSAAPLANKIEIYSWSALSSFATLATSVDLPPGYEEAITLSLAEKLSKSFARPVTPELAAEARAARAAITSGNSKPPKLATDSGLTFGR